MGDALKLFPMGEPDYVVGLGRPSASRDTGMPARLWLRLEADYQVARRQLSQDD